ncbi:hypothetical protein DFH09DRAFT_1076610 [Mycena vulgaris]|nr:hypothetical protein DFH09DRAFT_1076610 [Mycena vulgaris]
MSASGLNSRLLTGGTQTTVAVIVQCLYAWQIWTVRKVAIKKVRAPGRQRGTQRRARRAARRAARDKQGGPRGTSKEGREGQARRAARDKRGGPQGTSEEGRKGQARRAARDKRGGPQGTSEEGRKGQARRAARDKRGGPQGTSEEGRKGQARRAAGTTRDERGTNEEARPYATNHSATHRCQAMADLLRVSIFLSTHFFCAYPNSLLTE